MGGDRMESGGQLMALGVIMALLLGFLAYETVDLFTMQIEEVPKGKVVSDFRLGSNYEDWSEGEYRVRRFYPYDIAVYNPRTGNYEYFYTIEYPDEVRLVTPNIIINLKQNGAWIEGVVENWYVIVDNKIEIPENWRVFVLNKTNNQIVVCRQGETEHGILTVEYHFVYKETQVRIVARFKAKTVCHVQIGWKLNAENVRLLDNCTAKFRNYIVGWEDYVQTVENTHSLELIWGEWDLENNVEIQVDPTVGVGLIGRFWYTLEYSCSPPYQPQNKLIDSTYYEPVSPDRDYGTQDVFYFLQEGSYKEYDMLSYGYLFDTSSLTGDIKSAKVNIQYRSAQQPSWVNYPNYYWTFEYQESKLYYGKVLYSSTWETEWSFSGKVLPDVNTLECWWIKTPSDYIETTSLSITDFSKIRCASNERVFLYLTISSTHESGVTEYGTSMAFRGVKIESINIEVTYYQTDYNISVSPSSISIQQGSSGNVTLFVSTTDWRGDTISISCDKPSGWNVSGFPSSITTGGSWSVTISVPTSASAGTYTVSFKASALNTTKTANVTVTVTPAPRGFTMSDISPKEIVIDEIGGEVRASLVIDKIGDWTEMVTVSVVEKPIGVDVLVYPDSISVYPTTVNITIRSSLGASSGTLKIRASGGGQTQEKTATITVIKAGFDLSLNPSEVSVEQGGTITIGIGITPKGGFNETVTMSAYGIPIGVSITFVPSSSLSPPYKGSMRITVGSTVTVGTYNIIVRAVWQNIIQDKTLVLNVTKKPLPVLREVDKGFTITLPERITTGTSIGVYVDVQNIGEAPYVGSITWRYVVNGNVIKETTQYATMEVGEKKRFTWGLTLDYAGYTEIQYSIYNLSGSITVGVVEMTTVEKVAHSPLAWLTGVVVFGSVFMTMRRMRAVPMERR
jgi:hypothetical protein